MEAPQWEYLLEDDLHGLIGVAFGFFFCVGFFVFFLRSFEEFVSRPIDLRDSRVGKPGVSDCGLDVSLKCRRR
jgi:hypothetical protein